MPVDAAGGLRRSILRRAPRLGAALRGGGKRWGRHVLGLAPVILAALWMMRHFLPSSAIPAGTDMFGFVARARENSSWPNMVSVWAPSFYGAPRQFTLDLVLGFVNQLTGDPVATVKLLAFGALSGAGAFTYLLSYRWYRSRWVATVAGLFYMTSQQSLSRWGSGQLNQEIGFALAPLLIYLLAKCVDEFSVVRALTFTLALNAELLVRPDVVLWIAPFLFLYPVVRAAVRREEKRTAITIGRLGLIVLPATLALNLMQIVPLLAGVRAAWVSLGGLFGFRDLIDRSLGAYPSVLGFGREIGYISFTGQQNWQSHPWVPNWAYFGAATVLVALAFAALRRYRDHRTIFLAASALVAGFLAKSVKGPIGGPYQWAVQHLPLIPNLRDPNRWLIVQALAYAVLGSLTLSVIVRRMRAFALRSGRLRARLTRASIAALFALILLPVGPTLLSGFRTWRPAPGQIALLKMVEADHSAFTVASVPYDQTGRFLVQGTYTGWEHDLGGDSSAFTGHPAIADGGWSQRSQDFVAFTSGLLKNHDPAFQEILGATGTKYLVKLAYPPSQPHLLPLGVSPFWQQEAIDSIPGFQPLATNEQGTVYRLSSWSPLASIRPNLALILGGPSGIAALADFPGINLQNWAVITASDALSVGGLPELMNLVRDSKLVVVSDETAQDVAVLASEPLVQIPGITSDPGLDRVGQQLGSDASSRLGSLADQTAPVAAPQTFSVRRSFTVDRPRSLEVWTRIKSSPDAGRVAFSIDGRTVRTLTPVSPFEAGLRWVLVYQGVFARGSHQVAIRALPSQFGGAFELDETRVVDPVARQAAQSELVNALGLAEDKVAYAFDLQDVQKWNDSFDPFSTRVPVDQPTSSNGNESGAAFWEVLDPSHVVPSPGAASADPIMRLQLRPGRGYYAFVRHQFSAPQNWSNIPAIFLTIDGQGQGGIYEFVVSFGAGQASWLFRDDQRGLRTLLFTPENAQHGTPPFDWSHVLSVKLSTKSKASSASIGVGPVGISGSGNLQLSMPIVSAGRTRAGLIAHVSMGQRTVKGSAPIPIQPGATSIPLEVPYSDLEGGVRLVVPPGLPVQEVPAVPVPIERTGPASYGMRLDRSYSGTLTFDQGYDPKWAALIGGSRPPSVPLFSLMNGYLPGSGAGGLPTEPGMSQGSINYSGQRAASLGLALSAVSWLSLGVLALGLMRLGWRKRTRAFGPLRSGPWRRPSRVAVAMAVAICIGAAGFTSLRAWAHSSEEPVSYYWPQGVGGDPLLFWSTPDDKNVSLQKVDGPDGEPAMQIRMEGQRPHYAILGHTFAAPEDWTSRRDLFLYVRGEGTGTRYQFLIYTDDRFEAALLYTFVDIQPGWQALVFDLRGPTEAIGSPDLSHVFALRVATNQRTVASSLALGSMTVSQPNAP